MSSAFSFVKNKGFVWGLVAIVVIVGGFMLAGNGDEERETVVAERGDFVQEVSVSGKVVSAQDVTLSFAESGRVASISAAVGNTVQRGATLASLASSALLSDLRSAEASLALRRAEARNSAVNLDEIRSEQDALVASALRKLLSDGLAAVPNSTSYTVDAPAITGAYTGEEGTYKIRITDTVNASMFELRTFGLEATVATKILDDEPTPLGMRGLFVSFPDGVANYDDTIWEVTIPNTKSSSYLANYNAYQEALRARTRAIADAEASLRSGPEGGVSEAQIQQAEAEVARIGAAIAERTIRAPFTGIVTVVDIELGETASAGAPAISMISTGAFQIESYIPEANIALIEAGDVAHVTLDAYGPDVPFSASVVSIDPAETIRDGVSTYRTILEFASQNERIKSGMTANVLITTDKRDDVLSVPRGVVIDKDGKKYVQVVSGKNVEEREVVTGVVSSRGTIEILSGLSNGELVFVP